MWMPEIKKLLLSCCINLLYEKVNTAAEIDISLEALCPIHVVCSRFYADIKSDLISA
jgi:hypothetical protein